jgi:hypothetical protein
MEILRIEKKGQMLDTRDFTHTKSTTEHTVKQQFC